MGIIFNWEERREKTGREKRENGKSEERKRKERRGKTGRVKRENGKREEKRKGRSLSGAENRERKTHSRSALPSVACWKNF